MKCEERKNFKIVSNAKNMSQCISEVADLLDKLEKIKPKIIVEVGSLYCGLLVCIAKILPKSLFIAIDDKDFTNSEHLPKLQENIKQIPKLELLFNRDSHDPKTLQDLKRILKGRKIDFLFIDGDHSYEGVKKDFEMYSPLVKGLIGFHDIKDTPQNRDAKVFVPIFWKELREKYKTEEICCSQEFGGVLGGIGLLTWDKK